MKPEGQQEIYRVAYEAASSELKEIATALEQLRVRKDHIEKLVEVLGPLVDLEEKAAVVPPQTETSPSEEPVVSAAQSNSGEAGERGPDPFQRRIDHVLGIGAGIRDVRKYTRQF